jgi:hypothetical protein
MICLPAAGGGGLPVLEMDQAGKGESPGNCRLNQIGNPVFNFKKRDRHGKKNFKE